MHSGIKSSIVVGKDLFPSLPGILRMTPADIVFGTPSERCKGHGICILMPEGSISQIQCHRTRGMLFSMADSRLGVWIPINSLTTPVLETQFSGPYFLMQEKLELSDCMLNCLGLQGRYSIPCGRFGIRRGDQFILLELPLNRELRV